MSLTYKIWDFPNVPISKQLFTVPGAAVDGGFTTGGARISSPEPGGRGLLEIQPGLLTGPIATWLMSKINGQIFRVKLAATPQIADSRLIARPTGGTLYGGAYKDYYTTQPDTRYDITAKYTSVALEGSNILKVDVSSFGPILQLGHLIGHGDNCYAIDDISYSGSVATLTVIPPVRVPIAIGDAALFRPNFLGSISNGDSIRNTYDAENAGNIQLNNILFNEVIL